jgi:hypothetical protein
MQAPPGQTISALSDGGWAGKTSRFDQQSERGGRTAMSST